MSVVEMPIESARALGLIDEAGGLVTVNVERGKVYALPSKVWSEKHAIVDSEGDLKLEDHFFDRSQAVVLRDLLTAFLDAGLII